MSIAPDHAQGPAEAPARVGWQQRVEESALGRGILSTAIVLTLTAILAINLPGSELRRQLLRPAQPYLNALGLDQNWALFAPDPRRELIDVSAVVGYDNGQTALWHFPRNGALIGGYRDYRWRKWQENVLGPDTAPALLRPAALWAAGREARPLHRVVRVSLVEQSAPLAPPGVEPSVGAYRQRVIYSLVLSAPIGPKK